MLWFWFRRTKFRKKSFRYFLANIVLIIYISNQFCPYCRYKSNPIYFLCFFAANRSKGPSNYLVNESLWKIIISIKLMNKIYRGQNNLPDWKPRLRIQNLPNTGHHTPNIMNKENFRQKLAILTRGAPVKFSKIRVVLKQPNNI